MWIYWPTSFWPSIFLMRNLKIFRTPCMWWFTSLLLLSRFATFGKFDHNLFPCGSLWVHLTWGWLCFLDVYVHFFHQLWEVLTHFFKYVLGQFLSSPSRKPTMCVLVCFMVSHSSRRLCPRFLNMFSFCSSNSLISIVPSSSLLILLSAQICLWIPLVKFSCSVIIFSYSRIFFLVSL